MSFKKIGGGTIYNSVMPIQFAVAYIKGAEPKPFVIVGADIPEFKIDSLSDGMSEAEMRAHLKEHAETPARIDELIENAKKNPRP